MSRPHFNRSSALVNEVYQWKLFLRSLEYSELQRVVPPCTLYKREGKTAKIERRQAKPFIVLYAAEKTVFQTVLGLSITNFFLGQITSKQ